MGDGFEVADGEVGSFDVAGLEGVDVVAGVDEGGDGAAELVEVDDVLHHVV